MKAIFYPLAWGLATATIIALASGVALDMAASNPVAPEPQLQNESR